LNNNQAKNGSNHHTNFKANRIRWHKHPNVQQHPNPFDKANST
jgi:hypothetical protein